MTVIEQRFMESTMHSLKDIAESLAKISDSCSVGKTGEQNNTSAHTTAKLDENLTLCVPVFYLRKEWTDTSHRWLSKVFFTMEDAQKSLKEMVRRDKADGCLARWIKQNNFEEDAPSDGMYYHAHTILSEIDGWESEYEISIDQNEAVVSGADILRWIKENNNEH